MKQSVKKALVSSLILFILGISICFVSLVYAEITNTDIFDDSDSYTCKSYKIKINNIENQSLSRLHSLQIRGENINIKILPTQEESYIFFENSDSSNLKTTIENGILKITDETPFYMLGFLFENNKTTFVGLRNIFTSNTYKTEKRSLTVFLNQLDKLNKITLDINFGNIDISDISSKSFTAISKFGDINLNAMEFETAYISLKKGNISVKNCKYIFSDIQNIVGDININVDGNKTNCQTAFGKIKAFCHKDLTEYSISAYITNGKITVDNNKIGSKNYLTTSESSNSMLLKNTIGDISLYKFVTNE